MSEENRGKYASKHPEGTELEPSIANQIQIHLEDGRLACGAAIKIAEKCGVSLGEVGRNADLMEARIDRCILGLFGFEIEDGKKRRIRPAESVTPDLEEAIRNRLVEGRLECKAAWEIARERSISRYLVAQGCEALRIRMSNCQLGAF